ncbi:MAG: MATE family efflux transporter [Marinibacterium sp.]
MLYAASQGLLIGCLTFVAATPGRLAQVLRDGLAFALAISLLLALFCQYGAGWLTLLGQDKGIADDAGPILAVIGLGLPLHYLIVTFCYALEAQGFRPLVAFWVGLGFLMNLGLSAGLPFLLQFPAKAALWTVVLTTLAMRIVILIGLAQATRGILPRGAWAALPRLTMASGRDLRRIGLAAGAGIAIESAAFAALSVFAGWLGPDALAAYTILVSLVSIIFSLALAVAVLTAARIAAELSLARSRFREGLIVALLLMGLLGLAAMALRGPLIGLTVSDPEAAAIALPLVGLVGFLMLGDGGQSVAQNALRAIGDAWPATLIHLSGYLVLMVFGGWFLALPLERGVRGLLEATALASFTVLSLLTWRFWRLTASWETR